MNCRSCAVLDLGLRRGRPDNNSDTVEPLDSRRRLFEIAAAHEGKAAAEEGEVFLPSSESTVYRSHSIKFAAQHDKTIFPQYGKRGKSSTPTLRYKIINELIASSCRISTFWSEGGSGFFPFPPPLPSRQRVSRVRPSKNTAEGGREGGRSLRRRSEWVIMATGGERIPQTTAFLCCGGGQRSEATAKGDF